VEPDELLVRRSISDPSAFEPLVERHSGGLHGYLARRAPTAADDLLSEVWLEAFSARGAFDPDRGPLRGWLFGIARNVLNSHLRRRRDLPLGDGSAEGEVWDAVDARLDAARQGPALFTAVCGLPAHERELIVLVAIDGLTPTEVAAMLGIPATTARSRLHRARAHLREALDDPPAEAVPQAARPGDPSTIALTTGATS